MIVASVPGHGTAAADRQATALVSADAAFAEASGIRHLVPDAESIAVLHQA